MCDITQVEVHILGAASQEETLLSSYWPELGLLFPELSVLQCVAVCCSVLQCVIVCCSVL